MASVMLTVTAAAPAPSGGGGGGGALGLAALLGLCAMCLARARRSPRLRGTASALQFDSACTLAAESLHSIQRMNRLLTR
jgi:hypothetical protein